MRVIVTSSAMAGHFRPLVPFIDALRGGGHDVLVVVPESARAWAQSTGASVLVGGSADPDEVQQLWLRFREAEPSEASVIANRQIFGRLNTAALLPSVERAAVAHRPELVLHEPTEYAGPVTALRMSIPQAQVAMLITFDAIHAHPWLGTQLTVAPWQPAVLQLLERVGSHLDILGVPEHAQFDAASVFVHHLLGFASQFDVVSRLSGAQVSRPAFLEQATAAVTQHGGQDQYPFLTRIAAQLAGHDDREQYETGLDVIIAGIKSR